MATLAQYTRTANAKAEIVHALGATSTSEWLKNALRTALQRDPVDAANEAEHLAKLLGERADAMLAEGGRR